MDDHGSWREILARNQENAGAAAVVSLAWSAGYSVVKRLDFGAAFTAAGVSAMASATLWTFLSEYLNPNIVILIPVAVGCGIGTFPLMRAYSKRDDAIADGIVGTGEGWLSRFLKKRGGE